MRTDFMALIVLTAATWAIAPTGSADVISKTSPRPVGQLRHASPDVTAAGAQRDRAGSSAHVLQASHAPSGNWMIQLLIHACRANECRTFALLFDPHEMSLMNCMFAAQQEAARWASMNPGWSVNRLRCRQGGPDEVET